MIEIILKFLQDFPPQLATLILGALPIGEVRAALPVALVIYKMPLISALFWSVLGNILPVYFLLLFFERVTNYLRPRSPLYNRFCIWLFERTRRQLNGHVEKYGYWTLAIFVGLPLPMTGAWTGAVAAFVFGLDKKKAFLAITVGVLIAAVIVASLTLGVSGLASYLTAVHFPNLRSRAA